MSEVNQVPTPSSQENSIPPILLLVDIQAGLVEPLAEWECGPRSTPNFEFVIESVLETWRYNGWPIIHIVHNDTKDLSSPLSAEYPDPQFAKPHACSAPKKGEPVLVKSTGSAFVNTGLEKLIPDGYLKATKGKVGKVVVVGMEGPHCVNSTTRHGSDLGYDLVVVADGCASFGMKKWGKENTDADVDAEETNRVAMGMLNSYAKVVGYVELEGLFPGKKLKVSQDARAH